MIDERYDKNLLYKVYRMIMLIWYKMIWNESYQKIHTVQLA